MYIERTISHVVLKLSTQYPVLTITGPRQSGKTTLCQKLFPGKPYITLEDLETRKYSIDDPKGFLSQFPDGAILDEIQRSPDLLSYIQGIVDQRKVNGMFIITGSQQFEVMSSITQSLAGRTAIIKLLPLTSQEVYKNNKTPDMNTVLYTGFYPRIFDEKLNPTYNASFYITTYLERDVRQLINIQDLTTFETFLKVCAGRTGQIINYAAIANECGVDQKTIKKWISVLEASYIIKRLTPYYKNQNKRLVKSPKLYFLDTGLVCYLLGINKPTQLAGHPLYGAIFETYILSEIWKYKANSILMDNLYFYRDHRGVEIDVVFDHVTYIDVLEIKSGKTFNSRFARPFDRLIDLGYTVHYRWILMCSEDNYTRSGISVVSCKSIDTWLPKLDSIS